MKLLMPHGMSSIFARAFGSFQGRESKSQPHAVPLTKDILSVLDSLPRFKGGSFVFTTTAGKTPSWLSSKIKGRLDARMLRTLKALARTRGDDPASVTLPAMSRLPMLSARVPAAAARLTKRPKVSDQFYSSPEWRKS